MRNLVDMDTIQIEITNHCHNRCANCTRFVGHLTHPFFMDWYTFKNAVDSMKGYPKMVGIQGGEPLLHPEFEKFCKYLQEKFPKKQLGLWTTFPKGYERYRNVIVDTFHHIFLNDHTRNDIYHHPGLVAAKEVWADEKEMYYHIDRCWVQESWSASINPHGAFFCEIAASLSMLYDSDTIRDHEEWSVEEGWWWKTPKDFTKQIERWCPECGFCVPITRRKSTDNIDDISPYHFDKLRDTSPKIKSGNYNLLKQIELKPWEILEPLAAYKDTAYRNVIAGRYGMRVYINESLFWTPELIDENHVTPLDKLRKRFGA